MRRLIMVQFITHFTGRYSYEDSVRMALEGGCRWIQLRMKNVAAEHIYPIAQRTQKMCKEYGATFIIDDHVEIAKQIQADGVHLGKLDMPIGEARSILGNDFIIGGTANTFEDVKAHYEAGADYIGCGPFRYTTTKTNLSPLLGLDGYRRIISQMKEAGIDIPLVAIGGITKGDIPSLLETGVTGIALSGSILRAGHPIEEMRETITICHSDRSEKSRKQYKILHY